jgi:hypothetical protein
LLFVYEIRVTTGVSLCHLHLCCLSNLSSASCLPCSSPDPHTPNHKSSTRPQIRHPKHETLPSKTRLPHPTPQPRHPIRCISHLTPRTLVRRRHQRKRHKRSGLHRHHRYRKLLPQLQARKRRARFPGAGGRRQAARLSCAQIGAWGLRSKLVRNDERVTSPTVPDPLPSHTMCLNPRPRTLTTPNSRPRTPHLSETPTPNLSRPRTPTPTHCTLNRSDGEHVHVFRCRQGNRDADADTHLA